ncbi:hypothetical protein BN1080_01749 [Planococcus massiliensis]|uniref:Uncharacterized protein n=1 Tax=Planococcus massiliensis TaxID=1499687 RepID=A0A098EKC4_9BACL|nr:hypothetical protein [Planococcus massiliensis]CEG22814.1 hypothetical protein BN1080_01749 [Planococcus massiliensis]
MKAAFLKQEKSNIILFLITMLAGYLLSVILIGGPVTYSAPGGALLGFFFLECWRYKQFKKEWKIDINSIEFRSKEY